jgi:hypothetical protein
MLEAPVWQLVGHRRQPALVAHGGEPILQSLDSTRRFPYEYEVGHKLWVVVTDVQPRLSEVERGVISDKLADRKRLGRAE